MAEFQPYGFKDIGGSKGAERNGAEKKGVQESAVFDRFVERDLTQRHGVEGKEFIAKKVSHFNLDGMVSDQLGIEKAEKEKMEAWIAKELERRWEITREKAEVEGYNEGLELGRKQAYEAELPKIQAKLENLEKVILEIDSMKEKVFLANEEFLLRLIGRVIRMLVLREIKDDKEYIKRLVVHLLEQAGTGPDIRVTIPEVNAVELSHLRQEIKANYPEFRHVTIDVRPDMKENSCLIETKNTLIDSDLDKQIERFLGTITEDIKPAV